MFLSIVVVYYCLMLARCFVCKMICLVLLCLGRTSFRFFLLSLLIPAKPNQMSHPPTNHDEKDSHLKVPYAVQLLVAAQTQMTQVMNESQANNPNKELTTVIQQWLDNQTQLGQLMMSNINQLPQVDAGIEIKENMMAGHRACKICEIGRAHV